MNQIRLAVRGYYDVQQLRIQAGNRLVNHFLTKIGVAPGSKKSPDVEELLKSEYKTITEGIVKKTKEIPFVKDGLISDTAEYALVNSYISLKEDEKKMKTLLEMQVEEHPIWQNFLKDIKGVGPLMAAVLISEIDIYKAKYVSSLWKYAGLDVGPDGRGRGRYSEHLVSVSYVAKDETEKTKKSITFNPFLKTKLMGVLADSFIKSKSIYSDQYYYYKNRLENHPVHMLKTKAHRNNMAKRYMIKQFLRDLYIHWKTIEGLEVQPPYEEVKLGIKHTGTDDNLAEV